MRWDSAVADPNFIALAVGGVVTTITGILIARASKQSDARAQAEAALIGLGPQIIAQQNARIDALTTQIDAIWKRELECRRELDLAKRRIESLENHVKK